MTPCPSPGAIDDALAALDPATVADINPANDILRAAVEPGSPGLPALLTQTGYPVTWRQPEQLRSVHCGACAG